MKKMHCTMIAGTVKAAIVFVFILLAAGYVQAEELPHTIEWQLSDMKVVNRGIFESAAEGKLRSGILIEGKAVTHRPDAIFNEGVISISLTAFTPARDMPGQKQGIWQLRGDWSIIAKNADSTVAKARYNPHALSGALNALIPYDPLAESGELEADIRLQRGGVRPWAGPKAKGTFTGNSKFEGILTTPFIPSAVRGKGGRNAG